MRHHERADRLAVQQEPVQHRLQRVDRRHVHLEQEAVLAGDPVALADLRGTGGQLGDPGQLARAGPDPDPGGQRQAERGRVDVEAVAADHAGLLQPGDPLPDGRRGHAHPAGQLGGAGPRVGGQLVQQPPVDLVQQRLSVRKAVSVVAELAEITCRSHPLDRHVSVDRSGSDDRPRCLRTLYFVVSAVFHYLGPAFAVLLFARVDVLGVAWLRIAAAALVFAFWRRPWRLLAPRWTGGRVLLAWGAVLAAMNSVFYLALERLPLGTVGGDRVPAGRSCWPRSPPGPGATCSRWRSPWPASTCSPTCAWSASRSGFAFAAANAGCSPLHRARRPRRQGRDALRHRRAGAGDADRRGAGAAGGHRRRGAGVHRPAAAGRRRPASASRSSVIPYVTDQLAMARLPRATYALMVSLLPATATVIGVIVLTQIPGRPELLGVLLVVGGVALHAPAAPATRRVSDRGEAIRPR